MKTNGIGYGGILLVVILSAISIPLTAIGQNLPAESNQIGKISVEAENDVVTAAENAKVTEPKSWVRSETPDDVACQSGTTLAAIGQETVELQALGFLTPNFSSWCPHPDPDPGRPCTVQESQECMATCFPWGGFCWADVNYDYCNCNEPP